MSKGRRRSAALAALLLFLLFLVLTVLTAILHRDGERALTALFPQSPLVFADIRNAAGLWEAIEKEGIPDLLKKSRAFYELERLPDVRRGLELLRELETTSGISLDSELLMHLAGKGAALGLYRTGREGRPQWIAASRASLPAWGVMRAYFLRNSAGTAAGVGKGRLYREHRLYRVENGDDEDRAPHLFFIGDAVVAASDPAAAEAALDCFDGVEKCFRGREDTVFDSVDGERPGELHFLIRPSGLELFPGLEAPGDPWPRIEKMIVNVDFGARTRALFTAPVVDWGDLRPPLPGEDDEFKVQRYVPSSRVLLAAGRGIPLPEWAAFLSPAGGERSIEPLLAREWILAVRDFSEKEFIPFPRALLLTDEGSSRGALDALYSRFPRPAEKIRMSGFPAVLSNPVHRWGVELQPGGAAIDRYAAFTFDRSLLEETALHAAGGGEGGKGVGGIPPPGELLRNTVFYAEHDNAAFEPALRRIAVPLSAALGKSGGAPPGFDADIEIFSALRSAVIRVDADGGTLSGEADLNFRSR